MNFMENPFQEVIYRFHPTYYSTPFLITRTILSRLLLLSKSVITAFNSFPPKPSNSPASLIIFGIARTTLSTILTVALSEVRDNGFKSMEITFFPLAINASVRSPSSSGTRTVSEAWIPLRSTLPRSESR
jgi:hypothetical protein